MYVLFMFYRHSFFYSFSMETFSSEETSTEPRQRTCRKDAT